MFVHFAALRVFDQNRAKRFYADDFVADVSTNEDGLRWLELKFPGAETALHFLRRPDETPSKDPVLVFASEGVDATARPVWSRGLELAAVGRYFESLACEGLEGVDALYPHEGRQFNE